MENRITKGVVAEADGSRIALVSDAVTGRTHIGVCVKRESTADIVELDRDQLLEHLNLCRVALQNIDSSKDSVFNNNSNVEEVELGLEMSDTLWPKSAE